MQKLESNKLQEAENAWRPTCISKEVFASDEEAKTEKLYRKVRGVLNKLTPQKFNTLVSQVRTLHIDNCERLQGVIDLVFEKAVNEPNLSVAYALMCRELALIEVPVTSENIDNKINFRKLLIMRCQKEFEKENIDENARAGKIKDIENEGDPEKKKELQMALDEEDRKLRKRSVGNVRFIGELFKQQMLTVSIMVRCLQNLVDTIEEESLECLCVLLTTIGRDLEVDKKTDLSQFFTKMQEIVDRKHGRISYQVKFMLLDVIELRKSKWIPRRANVKPKTIDQIQKEAEHEQMNIQMMNSGPQSNTPCKDDNRQRLGAGGKRFPVTKDSWSTPASRSRPTYSVQTQKLQMESATGKSTLNFEQVRLILLAFFKAGIDLDNVINWISTNIGDVKLEYKVIIRALITAVVEYSLEPQGQGEWRLNRETLKKYYSLLQCYIDNQESRELQCIYAVQALINRLEHPPGLALSIFDRLWDDSILSTESLLSWEKCVDPAEQEGKGEVLKTLICLLMFLKN